jgi:hypothetical protein
MACETAAYLLAADALEHRLCNEVTLARDAVSSTVGGTAKEQCAVQEALCRAMLLLEQTKKERFICQLQADVDSTKAKLVFLDNNVIQNVDLYGSLMMTGVDLQELACLAE